MLRTIIKEVLILPDGMKDDDDELHTFALTVQWRGAPNETGTMGGYAVTQGGRKQLSRAGNWAYPEPFQYHQYRWEKLGEAVHMAQQHVNDYKVNGKTWKEWQAS